MTDRSLHFKYDGSTSNQGKHCSKFYDSKIYNSVECLVMGYLMKARSESKKIKSLFLTLVAYS